ncbi:pyridoxal-phosphate-dependent aminotransferase family protein [Paracoccus pacificus]|uniref:Pyridoxal-phosphate-dependent aminotransferase family protein n=1 Tax=Paracoccus pacificus TaxID=1463598 RepID=A0ABW4RAI0_9RHOB
MSFAAGRPFLAIPGPSPLPDRVARAMHRPAPDIYGDQMLELGQGLFPDLKRLAGTSANLAAYIGNGHAGWEAANVNMLRAGDRALVLSSGHFGNSWAASARALGVDVEVMEFTGGKPADPARLSARLQQPDAGGIRAILTTQVDTATSVRNDIPALRAAIDAAGHQALFAVDAIASLGCEPLLMDEWGIDVLVGASQKGLMMAPGLAFVWFSDRARAAARLAPPYWAWQPRADAVEGWQFWGGTAPVQHMFGLREALDMLLEDEGLPAAYARHEGLAQALWAAVDAWGSGGDIAALVDDPNARARSVTAIRIGGGRATPLREWLDSRCALVLGIGLGAADPASALRVAHMGHVSAHQMLGTIACMDAGMTALQIPHGSGATEAAAKVIARLA